MALIECKDLTHVYLKDTPLETMALNRVTLSIDSGEFIGIIGPTGSGKSTLIQHFNALLRPTDGAVYVDGVNTADRKADLRAIRRKVGLVFQYPEHQLFEETVFKDVAFGPRNLGLDEDDVNERVGDALIAVGIEPSKFGQRSPFSLSGGEMRRVAIAGVLAMAPQVLVLDEPAAGLDPQGKAEILNRIRDLHNSGRLTVILITHNMDDAAQFTQRLIVLDKGRVAMDGAVREVFAQAEELRAMGLGVPVLTDLVQRLRRHGVPVRTDVVNPDEAQRAIEEALAWN